jgi:hypothetical protein
MVRKTTKRRNIWIIRFEMNKAKLFIALSVGLDRRPDRSDANRHHLSHRYATPVPGNPGFAAVDA